MISRRSDSAFNPEPDAIPELKSPPLQPSLPAAVLLDPVYRKRMRLMAQEWLTKKEAYWLAGVGRATWDRARKAKREGNPAYQDFPDDHRPSGNPKGHLRFQTVQVIAWASKRS